MTAFIDTNIPIYAGGGASPLQEPCAAILDLASSASGSCLTSALVLQELLHVRLRRRGPELARAAVEDLSRALYGSVVPIDRDDVLTAARLASANGLSGGDRVHIAVMNRLGIDDIITADRAFEGIPGIRRLDPLALADWRDSVFG